MIGGGVALSSLYNFIPRLPVPPFLFWNKTWPGARCMRMHETTADNVIPGGELFQWTGGFTLHKTLRQLELKEKKLYNCNVIADG